MMRRLRRIATTQAKMIKKNGTAITGPNHGTSALSMMPTEIGVSRKKFNNKGCGLQDAWAKWGALPGR